MEKEINNELEKTLNYLQDEIVPSLKRQIEEKQEVINKTIKYCEDSSKTIKSEYFSNVLKILKGEIKWK